MKTADGVEFSPEMDLWTFEGDLTFRNKGVLPEPHGDTFWVGYDLDHRINLGSTIDLLYSSREAAMADYNSPRGQCFCCGFQLTPECRVSNDATIGAIYPGLFFRATGNYGSTIFDPMTNQFIEIVICDKCVVERQDRLRHWAEKPGTHPREDRQAPPYELREDVARRFGING